MIILKLTHYWVSSAEIHILVTYPNHFLLIFEFIEFHEWKNRSLK